MTLRTSISGGRSRSTRGRSVGSARPRSPRAHTKACAPTRRHTRAHRHARTRASWAHAASTGACARSLRMRTSSGGRARSARLSTRSCRDTQPLSLRAAIAPATATERCCATHCCLPCRRMPRTRDGPSTTIGWRSRSVGLRAGTVAPVCTPTHTHRSARTHVTRVRMHIPTCARVTQSVTAAQQLPM
jgi:hypothetical protein